MILEYLDVDDAEGKATRDIPDTLHSQNVAGLPLFSFPTGRVMSALGSCFWLLSWAA